MPNKLNLEVGASTETGYVRKENQDRMSWASTPLGQLYIVADGMGGHAGGSKAAALTVGGLEQFLKEVKKNEAVETAICNAFEKTNKDLYDQAHIGDPTSDGMGSTAVMLLISGQSARIAHVGDSRAYLYRNGKLSLLTKDHTQVQRMVDAGMLTPEQARHHPSASILDRAIGNRPSVVVEISSILTLADRDVILLCSDGLSGYVADKEIEAAIDETLTPQENVNRLISLALQNGGEDNVTVQLIRVGNVGKAQGKTLITAVKSIGIFFFILVIVAGGSYLTYRLLTKTSEENKLFFKSILHQQDSLLRHALEEIRKIANPIAKVNIVSSEGELLSEKNETDMRVLNPVSQTESQLQLAHQNNQILEKRLADMMDDKKNAEQQLQETKDLTKVLENKLIMLKKKYGLLKLD
jgi:protein phosphatase